MRTEGSFFAPPVAREETHQVLCGFCDFAKDHNVWISVGLVAVPSMDEKVINRRLLINCSGQITNRYDKLHLFDIQLFENEEYCESAGVTPG